jgi:acyl-CoA dehydrogenase
VSEELDLIAATVGRIFADRADPQTIALEPDDNWRQRLWGALEDAGIPQAWAPEAAGGAGLDAEAVGRIARIAGGHAVAVPLVETMLANRWAGLAGLDIMSGMIAFAPTRPGEALAIDGDGCLAGTITEIPLADDSANAVVLAEASSGSLAVARLDLTDHIVASRQDYAGDRRVRVRFDSAKPEALGRMSHGRSFDGVMAGAALRACQMAGAMAAVLEHTVEYAGDRNAFGRPIAKFQAVQHHLATFAGETAAASVVADDAMAGLGQDDERAFFTTACAKVRAGEAAYECARIAHQVFGAIGYTEEHLLHRYTQRLWAWRDDFGNESEWATLLGQSMAANGDAAHWTALTAGAVTAP